MRQLFKDLAEQDWFRFPEQYLMPQESSVLRQAAQQAQVKQI